MKLTVREMVLFAMFGAIMYVGKILLVIPHVHPLGVFIIAFTVVYRKKALYPIYVYIFIEGLFAGFATWWIPYLYIWTVLWGMTMLLPQKLMNRLPKTGKMIVYMVLCAVHGFLFGLLYTPAQAIFYGLNFDGAVAWWVTGFLTADIYQGSGNFVLGALILPIVLILQNTNKYTRAT